MILRDFKTFRHQTNLNMRQDLRKNSLQLLLLGALGILGGSFYHDFA
jgi:hypothetical protein